MNWDIHTELEDLELADDACLITHARKQVEENSLVKKNSWPNKP